eukprot:3665796-Lingulodinium_polyedra.AAC.1
MRRGATRRNLTCRGAMRPGPRRDDDRARPWPWPRFDTAWRDLAWRDVMLFSVALHRAALHRIA